MKAMLLAAGRGERMRPLTDHTPKPLLKVAGKPLIEYHLEALATAGIQEVVINTAHLPHLFPKTLGDGKRFGLTIHYSQEPEGALETGGGIVKALPLLGKEPFLVINSDIFTDYPFKKLKLSDDAHIVLVPNPPHHPQGDYPLLNNGPCFTFSGIGIYSREFFKGVNETRFSLTKLLNKKNRITRELYQGVWMDIGTPERLKELEICLRKK